ncbi:zinc-finger domain-containing protein [Pelagibacterium sp.]|uniref:zinc-finger domain-containing protein n=1 Tax=Pelagibacterium sp. TaxID=1967288 RepID=UPI003A8F92BB
MAQHGTPHFHNSEGLDRIEIGAKEFQCVGANPPFDHPHVFLDMGHDVEIVCPYCSTLYAFSPTLPHGAANPPGAVFEVERA